MTFTIVGIVLSPEEYLKEIKDAPLCKKNGNLDKWVKFDANPVANFHFHKGLVQVSSLDVCPGDKVHLAFEEHRNYCKLIDWRIEK